MADLKALNLWFNTKIIVAKTYEFSAIPPLTIHVVAPPVYNSIGMQKSTIAFLCGCSLKLL